MRQCIELSHNSKHSKRYVICNIYKPPNQIADDLNIFIRKFSNTLSSYQIDITLHISVVILILIYRICIQIIIGFLPQITLPTRIGEAGYRSSLIDNIFTNAIDAIEHTISGTLLTDITDHKAIFTSVNNVQYK